MTLARPGKSWPFRWTQGIKYIRDQLDVFIDMTPGSKAPVILKSRDYDLLMTKLPKEFLVVGTPLYRGREIVKLSRFRNAK